MQCEDCGVPLGPRDSYGGGTDWSLCAGCFFDRQVWGIATDDGESEDVFGFALMSVRDRSAPTYPLEGAAVGPLPGLEAA